MTLNPYQTLRSWDRKKVEFPDIKGSEELCSYTLLCIEEQISYMSKKCDSIYDEDVALVYAICGMRIIGILDLGEKFEFDKVASEVWELSDRCMATFNPEDYKRIVMIENDKDWQNAEHGIWETPEDRLKHYRMIGSTLRRLTDSRKFWSKKQGRKGYINHVSSFIEQNSLSDQLGTIHYTFMVRRSADFSL